MAVSFSDLKDAYPTEPKSDLFNRLGGEWPQRVDDANYQNTCAVRMSVALKAVGVAIPAALREAMEGNGSPLVLKVKTMEKLVSQTFGGFYWGMTKVPGTPVQIPRKTGIIVYHVQWKDASGHFDLWTGDDFVGAGNFANVADGFDIALWSID